MLLRNLALLSAAPVLAGGVPAALNLNFIAGTYNVAGTSYGSLATIPGYSYTRTGTLTVLDSDGTIDTFAANTEPINGFGLHHYAAVTNICPRSQEFNTWNFTAGVTMTPDTTVAPDGTTTADTYSGTGGGTSLFRTLTSIAAQPYTFSFFALRGTLTDAKLAVVDAGVTNIIPETSYYAQTNGATFSRIVQPFTSLSTSTYIYPAKNNTSAGTEFLWQAQCLDANLPDGGPIIPTTGINVTTGAAALSFTFPNGSYSPLYTFDDNSTQTVPVVVSAGVLTLPTAPTLNRGRIKSIVI